jgi:16S rRNA (adenine1518-N6/adenine1519-N6)-dimethyltransferase
MQKSTSQDKRHQPRKRFGQNFLHDEQILERILWAISPYESDRIVEIGPGEGALTCPLLEHHGRLTAIELDRDLVGPLIEKCSEIGHLDVIQADAMNFDFSSLATAEDKIRIVGNLPYNISTPILFHLAGYADIINDLHVLLQKEVAERIASAPGRKSYGKLSVMMQARFDTELLFNVRPEAFRPPPKVTSTFIRLLPRQQPVAGLNNHEHFNTLVTAAFSQRRKTLRNSLQALLSKEEIKAVGIDPTRRAETLTLEEFAALGNVLESRSPVDE